MAARIAGQHVWRGCGHETAQGPRDLVIAVVGGVLVDQGGRRGGVAHPPHELLGARAGRGRQCRSGVPQLERRRHSPALLRYFSSRALWLQWGSESAWTSMITIGVSLAIKNCSITAAEPLAPCRLSGAATSLVR
jgi:hypothetical protein